MAKQLELDGWSYPKHSKDEFTVWWFMVTWQVPKVCAEPNATGWTGWDLWTPGKWLAWIAISATTIPTLPAMTNWIPTWNCMRKYETWRGQWSMRGKNGVRAICPYLMPHYARRDRNNENG